MKRILFLSLIIIVACQSNQQSQNPHAGLFEEVEVLRDKWGINHIYAKNQHDLFYAQGYQAAKDRLFQFEIWRRQATGTVSEILGERELQRDIGTRLFKFRGDIKEEMNHYHPDGEEIITAYVDGVNAYIQTVLNDTSQLPFEFNLLNIRPGLWTPEVVISRHQGLLGNISQELANGMAVAALGPEMVKNLNWFHPQDPNIKLDSVIVGDLLTPDILSLYHAYRRPVRFQAGDLQDAPIMADGQSETPPFNEFDLSENDQTAIGSNNWIVAGSKTASGSAMMANDPHRSIAVPSLRYMVHLVAPGWNVIGGGEPEIPGISIGHNAFGAWGLTVFRTDGEDLYVYDLNPENLRQYRFNNEWLEMTTISETIKIKDQSDYVANLNYTHHGPVTYIDSANFKAYAVKCAWLEFGGSPYLASLRMDQADSWEAFKSACNFSNIPGENMIWADKEGNIGWQAVGIAPIRSNHSGLVPVPGDGRYEWDGYLPIIEKPNDLNPNKAYLSTANQNVTPSDYEHWDAVGFSWSDPYRGERVNEVLQQSSELTIEDMMQLQTDYLSIPAQSLIPKLMEFEFKDPQALAAQHYLKDWDYYLEANSIAAGIYAAWEDQIKFQAADQFIPDAGKNLIRLQLFRIMEWIDDPELIFSAPSIQNRDVFLRDSFIDAIKSLSELLGPDMDQWHYGQASYKHIAIKHPLSDFVSADVQSKIDLPALPRGGNAYTPGSSGSNKRQTSGATFRIIVDTDDWDTAMGTNSPGQSGNPDSPFYNNLYESWANDQFFPVYFSRDKIESALASKEIMYPDGQ